MVQQVTIPLSALNALPGVSGVADVTFSVPEVADIVDAVVENTLDRTDVDEALEEQLSALDTPDLADLEVDLPEVDFPEVQAFAQAFVEELTNLEGFFGPVEGDFRRALEDVLGDPEISIDGLELGLGGLQDTVEDVQQELQGVNVPSVAEIQEAAQQAAEDALDAVLPDWITQPLEETAADLLNRLVDQAVSDESQETVIRLLE